MAGGRTKSKYITQMVLDNGIRLPKAEVFYRARHCDGLRLRVSPTGTASFPLSFDVKGDRGKRNQVKKTLAARSEVREGVVFVMTSLEEAVRWAEGLKAAGRAGRNPIAEQKAAASKAAANTVAAAVERWLAACETGIDVKKKLRPKTISGYRQIMRCDVMPRWGDRPIASISEDQVKALLDEKATGRMRQRKGATGGAIVQRNRVATRLHTFFTWCVQQKLLASNPAANIVKTAEEERDRVLSDNEIVAFWGATEGWDGQHRTDRIPWGAIFRLLLLTAQRENEVALMRWRELDDLEEPRLWEIPGRRTKNGKPHFVHLSDCAVAELQKLPHRGELVFGPSDWKPSFSRPKEKLDRAMGVTEPWRIHDLRRCAASGMARLKIAPHVVDKTLNHTAGIIRGVARIYNKYEYLDERKAALETWGNFVEGLVSGKVAQLRNTA